MSSNLPIKDVVESIVKTIIAAMVSGRPNPDGFEARGIEGDWHHTCGGAMFEPGEVALSGELVENPTVAGVFIVSAEKVKPAILSMFLETTGGELVEHRMVENGIALVCFFVVEEDALKNDIAGDAIVCNFRFNKPLLRQFVIDTVSLRIRENGGEDISVSIEGHP